MKQLVCLSQSAWHSVPTRTQHLMTRLKDVEILFFEPSPSSLSHSRRKGAYRKPGRQVRPNITVFTLPPVIPVTEGHDFLEQRNLKRVARYIQSRMELRQFQQPLLWIATPVHARLADRLPHRGLVYDCSQDWSHLPILWESELTYNADVVFAASPNLMEHLSPCSSNLALIPNGSNHVMFDRVGDSALAFPCELVPISSPVFGYSGTIWGDLDLEPVAHTARLHPNWSFVFVGRVLANPGAEELAKLPNVHFLGPRPLPDMPEYVTRFNVCLSLIRRGQVDNDVLSARIYEYLSTGLPIVSMYNHRHEEEYPRLIYSAYSPEGFEKMCVEALSEGEDDPRREERRACGASAAWTERAGEVQRILEGNALF